MKNILSNIASKEGFRSFVASLTSIALGLVIGFAVLLVSNPSNAVSGLVAILTGGISKGAKSFGQVLYLATPIIMTGLAFAFAAKAGLFNIGMPGQFIVGAATAIYSSINFSFVPKQSLWAVSILSAMVAGAAWAVVSGLLKAYANVNEVITSIMMNYIGMYLVNMLIPRTNIYNASKNLTVAPGAFVPTAFIGNIFPDTGANIGIIVALVLAVGASLLLDRTAFGYEIKVCGLNRYAAKYAGINEKRAIIIAMAISGMLAGIGGGLFYLSNTGKYIQVVDVLAAEGFNGIPVALLAQSNPIGSFFSGIFIAYLNVGSLYMQRYGFVSELINIVVAVIIYCSALSSVFKNFLFNRRKNKNQDSIKLPT